MLLEAGADVDARADMYGGDCTPLGLAATSVYPEKAGVQEELMQVLLDHGAAMGPARNYGRPSFPDSWVPGQRPTSRRAVGWQSTARSWIWRLQPERDSLTSSRHLSIRPRA